MKIVLAYSGGLDTSVALRWLIEHYAAEVIAFCADLGQPASFEEIRRKAEATGASKVYIEDLREEYLGQYVLPALRASAVYEGRYLMAAPLGRPLIAKRMVEIAHLEGAEAVAHGSTGKGNDQVRFYSGVVAHDPGLRVLAPAIEWELKSREDEISYARKHDIPISASPARPYSIDGSIWGTSTECGILDDFTKPAPEDAFQMTTSPEAAPTCAADVRVGFERGAPVSLNGVALPLLEIVTTLNQLGGAHAIGRTDMIENSLLGIKSRAIYESPAGTILHAAHRELEDLTIDRDTLHYKTLISQKYAELIYYGLWFSPLREALDAFVTQTQARVTGFVTLRLRQGSITVLTRESRYAMYDYALTAHDSQDRFHHPSGEGFSYVWAMPLRINAKIPKPEDS